MINATIFFPSGDGLKILGLMEVDRKKLKNNKHQLCNGFITIQACEDNFEEGKQYLKTNGVPYLICVVNFVADNSLVTNIYRLGVGTSEVINGGKEIRICFLDSALEGSVKNKM